MKHYFFLFLLSILVFSCDLNGQEETDRIDSINIEAIANNPYYMAFSNAVRENAHSIAQRMFDHEKIDAYVLKHYPNEEDLCVIDFSGVDIRGLQLYMEQMCTINRTHRELKEHIPVYGKLNRKQKAEIRAYYYAYVNPVRDVLPPSPHKK